MEMLHDAAKYATMAKNIGREVKPNGGMADGHNTIANNKAAKAMKRNLPLGLEKLYEDKDLKAGTV